MTGTLRPPVLPRDVLAAFAARTYGIDGDWIPLQGERDQNFRVSTPVAGSFVFKLCNPAEGVDIVRCQAQALEHIAAVDPLLPAPRLRRTCHGEILGGFTHEGSVYPVMVLSWLEGEVLGESHLPPEYLFQLGQLLATLGVALRGFISGVPAERDLAWDTRHLMRLAPQLARLPDEDRDLAQDILSRHAKVTMPALQRMRCQIIHGDVHPYNTLRGPDGSLSGIIDFGDLVHAPLLQDLANSVAEFLDPSVDVEMMISEMVRGYRSITPLEEAEAESLVDLIEARLIMTPLIDSLKASVGITPLGHLQTFSGRSMPMIRVLREIGRESLTGIVRRAAAFPTVPRPIGVSSGEAVARRRQVMGEKLYVFYDPPLHMVKGDGVWLESSDGRRFLDCYNNVPHVGHCHPFVTEAIARQARTLNTNTRYITDQSIEYAERLVALSSDGLTSVVFVNSGSEANDLAWRMAKAFTGRSGGLAMEFAYHGVTEATDAFSPSNAPDHWRAPHIRLLPAPDLYRGSLGPEANDVGERYAAMAEPLIASLQAAGHGVAAAMIDSAFITNGILDAPPGYLQGVATRVRQAGGLLIADEVQSGFGRMGTAFWGHRHHGVTPDIITIGKPAGNGYPLGAVIARPEILAHFLKAGPFFSTFGGNNVACAAGIAVLDVIRDEGLVENARCVGTYLREELARLMERHAVVGDVRGVGLAIGVELVRDRVTKEPAPHETSRALNLLRDEGVLIGGEGKFGNVLKIRPPIVFTRAHADTAVSAMDRALAKL